MGMFEFSCSSSARVSRTGARVIPIYKDTLTPKGFWTMGTIMQMLTSQHSFPIWEFLVGSNTSTSIWTRETFYI